MEGNLFLCCVTFRKGYACKFKEHDFPYFRISAIYLSLIYINLNISAYWEMKNLKREVHLRWGEGSIHVWRAGSCDSWVPFRLTCGATLILF